MILKKYQKHAFLIILLPIIGMLIGRFTSPFRYTNLRTIYLIGALLVYICWITSFLLGIINSIEIILNSKEGFKKKILWTIISLLPIIYITTIVAISVFKYI
jgi:hypothetical protein